MIKIKMLFVILTLLFSYDLSNSQNILVWKNVGESEYISFETGNLQTSDYELRLALTVNYRSIVVVDSLPEDLSLYDMIFITLGFAVDCG
jgi:hypothetical protein